MNWSPGVCGKSCLKQTKIEASCSAMQHFNFSLQGGFLGALQVKDSYKRMGLGSVAACAASRCIAEQGDDVVALVNPENTPSRGMFNKLGFTVTERCYWLRTFPTVANYSWPDGE